MTDFIILLGMPMIALFSALVLYIFLQFVLWFARLVFNVLGSG